VDRKQRNAESKAAAEHDREPWGSEDLEYLRSWDGSERYLAELAELLGRTIEACREQFYQRRRRGWSLTEITTTTTTTTTYRGWTEADGDGWT
jgi:hypothetical protein